MDFADGGDMHTKIKERNGRLFDENQLIDWFVQVCLALKHVHDRKIIHRDLKAQNIFLTKTGRIKLGDFGIAKVLNSTMENAKTMVGTPYYLSPEIVEGRPYSFKSDIWSLGVLFYEMCSLKPPFDASSLHFLALKIVRGVYNPLPRQLSQSIRSLIAKLLKTDQNRRPTIHEILKEPIIRNRIKNFLSEKQRQQEFSHTIIHKYSVLGQVSYSFDGGLPPTVEEEEKQGKINQEMLKSIKELKSDLKNNQEIDREVQEEGIMLCEMNEIVLAEESIVEPVSAQSLSDLPPEDIEDSQENIEPEAHSNTVIESETSKVSLMKKYLEQALGKKVLKESVKIINTLVPNEDNLDFDVLYPNLEHILDKDQQTEYVPIIYSLIELMREQNSQP